MRLIKIFLIILIIIHGTFFGCSDEFLNQQPLSQLSQETFWDSYSDAMLALTGIYQGSNIGDASHTNEHLILSSDTDDSGYKNGAVGVIYSGYLLPSDGQVVEAIWNRAYRTIFRANYFLENIENVEMDEGIRLELIAEARFLRAYEYFYMSVLYGGVPLVTKSLTAEEAADQTRNTLEEIQDFVIKECTEAANNLPALRPEQEKGRILKGAALGIKGRTLLIQEKWKEASTTFKEIIDLDSYIIDPRYKELFEEEGENSKEIILSTNCIAGLYGNTHNQLNFHPDFYGGYQETNFYQNLIDEYKCVDGLSIHDSPMYDPDAPFVNRDPRLYETVFLPGYTEFRGRRYPDDPESTQISSLRGATGYGWKKFVTEDYDGDLGSSGDDIILMRYAEILLGYLEAKMENGDDINQDLLDITINKIRGRESINMPFVETKDFHDREELRRIIRNEYRVEFAGERLIRYMSIRRWGIYHDRLNQIFYGMKLTNDPDNYNRFPVAKEGPYAGHYIAIDKRGSIHEGSHLIPIPLREIDINPKLEQNPGY